jgi:membrane protein implicated in regulation of membrane protease activity
MPMYCTGCGFLLARQEPFCPKCGQANGVAPALFSPAPVLVASAAERLWKARIFIGLGCFLLAVVLMSTLQSAAGWMGLIACIAFGLGWSSTSIRYENKLVFVVICVILVAFTQWGELAYSRKQTADRQADQNRLAAQRAQKEQDTFNRMTPAEHLAVAQADLKLDATEQRVADATKNLAALKGTSLESRGDALRARYETEKAEADEKARAAEAKVAAEAEAEAKAQAAAYSRSRAGKLCAKHLDWTRDDCESVAHDRIWIGMSLEMLEANRGRPNSANPSNYGNGVSWQWCWDDYTPSCFYGGSDQIITAYN